MEPGVAFLIGALVGGVGGLTTAAMLVYWFVVRPMN
jgi:hypothetical protein